MPTFTGSVGIVVASIGSVAAIALSSATPALGANQALMLNGIGGGADLPDIVMSQVLGGEFATYQRSSVPWPQQANPVTGTKSLTLAQSVAVGVDNLDAAIKTALTKIGPGEHVTVVGLSAGALVADAELARLAADPTAPSKSLLTFVAVADSSRANFNKNRFDTTLNYQYQVPVPTKYDTVVVAAEYDGFADFPDRVWNIVAVVNAFAGEILNHVPSVFTDLSTVSTSDITVTTNSLGGVTTAYFVPSATLPLVELVPFLKPFEAQLKKIVDAGYVRNDAVAAAATPAAAVTVAGVSAPAATRHPVAPASAAAAPAPDLMPRALAPASAAAAPAPDLSTLAETAAGKHPVLAAPAAASVEAPQSKAHRGPGATGGAGAGPAPAAAVATRAKKSSG